MTDSLPPLIYRAEVPVRFTQCDPAGIVFYPRYFEMFNDLVEDWCREGLQCSFPEIIMRRGWGLPTVHLEVDFSAPSTFGEVLSAALTVRSVGTSSIGLRIVLTGQDAALRVAGNVVLVLIDRSTRLAIPLPDDLRAMILKFKQQEDTR